MTCEMLVVDEKSNEYQGKKGLVSEQQIVLLDQSATGGRVDQLITYALTPAERTAHSGKIRDKRVRMEFTHFLELGGSLRARGRIVEVLK